MDKKIVTVQLNADGVLNPLLSQLSLCQNIILFGLRSIEMINEFPKETKEEEEAFLMHIGEPISDLKHQKKIYTDWLIKKGFEDLSKGLKLALIEAYFYVSIIEKKETLRAYQDFINEVEQLRKTALEQSMPGLLSKVTPYLNKELNYIEEVSSINLGRNCLVHSDGIVTNRHINDKENDRLNIKGIQFKLFYEQEDKEVEIKSGSFVPGNTNVRLKLEPFSLSFQKSQHLEITIQDFNNFVKTCYLFGNSLKESLPIIKN